MPVCNSIDKLSTSHTEFKSLGAVRSVILLIIIGYYGASLNLQ
jgi:hypothetical protein